MECHQAVECGYSGFSKTAFELKKALLFMGGLW
jgi:hypothetical protein